MCLWIFTAVILKQSGKKRFLFQAVDVSEIKVSVVVAFRNEEENISNLIEGLKNQSHKNVEFILINDHSEDKSYKIAKVTTKDNRLFKVFSLPDSYTGKKAALKYGGGQAKGKYVLYTDADCCVQPLWIEKTVKYMEFHCLDLCSGTVCINPTTTWLDRLQSVEFTQLVGIGHALVHAKHPVMCNGANLAIERKLLNAPLRFDISSGDDVFMLQYAFKNGFKIGCIDDVDTIVFTSAMSSFAGWLKQRMRWLSKSKSYEIFHAIFFTFIVGLAQIALLCVFFSGNLLFIFALWLLKIASEMFFLLAFVKLRYSFKMLVAAIVLGVIYPFFAVTVCLLSSTLHNFWKGRKTIVN